MWPKMTFSIPGTQMRRAHLKNGKPFWAHLNKAKGTIGGCDCDMDESHATNAQTLEVSPAGGAAPKLALGKGNLDINPLPR